MDGRVSLIPPSLGFYAAATRWLVCAAATARLRRGDIINAMGMRCDVMSQGWEKAQRGRADELIRSEALLRPDNLVWERCKQDFGRSPFS